MVMMSVAEQHSTVRGSLAGAAAVCTEHTTSTTIAKHTTSSTTWQRYCKVHYLTEILPSHYFKHYLAAQLPSHYLMVLLHNAQVTVHCTTCLVGAAAAY